MTKTPTSDETCKIGCHCAYNRRLYSAGNGPLAVSSSYFDPNSKVLGGIDAYFFPFEPHYNLYESCSQYDHPNVDLDCSNVLPTFFAYRNAFDYPLPLALTSENMTLLKHYGSIPCNVSDGPGANGSIQWNTTFFDEINTQSHPWRWVPDDDPNVVLNPYDCFGNFTSIASVLNTYSTTKAEFAGTPWGYDYTSCQDVSGPEIALAKAGHDVPNDQILPNDTFSFPCAYGVCELDFNSGNRSI